jgi:phage gp16-like protein
MKAPAKTFPAIERGRRNAELAAIHVAKKRLGLDDSTYREMLSNLTRGRIQSAADATADERRAIIEHLRVRGFKRTPADEKRERRGADNSQLRMIYGLWKQLRYAGALKDASERHLSAFVKKMTGIERAEWLAPAEAIKVTEGLKKWRDRVAARADEERK